MAVASALQNAGITGPLADVLTAAASTAAGAAVGGTSGAATGNEVASNFLKHDQATRMKTTLNACKAQKSGCSDSDLTTIQTQYRALSNANIAEMQGCILHGDRQCVDKLTQQAASVGEVTVPGVGGVPQVFENRASKQRAPTRRVSPSVTSWQEMHWAVLRWLWRAYVFRGVPSTTNADSAAMYHHNL